MQYSKKPYTKLHHIEIHPAHDGSHQHTVVVHLHHMPPIKKGEHLVPPGNEPNREHRIIADHEDVGEHVQAIADAHQHEFGRRSNPAGGKTDETENTRQPGNNGQDEWDEAHANYED